MDSIYFFVTSSDSYKDILGVFKEYFEKQGGFTSSFLIALAVGAIFAVVYYTICRFSFSWAKLSTWIITLFVAGAVSFVYTGYNTGISNPRGDLSQTLEKQHRKKIVVPGADKVKLNKCKADLKKSFKKGMFACSPVNSLCWTNFVLTLLFFYVFSLLVNGLSGYGVNIPHKGLIRP